MIQVVHFHHINSLMYCLRKTMHKIADIRIKFSLKNDLNAIPPNRRLFCLCDPDRGPKHRPFCTQNEPSNLLDTETASTTFITISVT